MGGTAPGDDRRRPAGTPSSAPTGENRGCARPRHDGKEHGGSRPLPVDIPNRRRNLASRPCLTILYQLITDFGDQISPAIRYMILRVGKIGGDGVRRRAWTRRSVRDRPSDAKRPLRTNPGTLTNAASRLVRAHSSAGEHYLDTVGVTGSIPVAPTTAGHRKPTETRGFSVELMGHTRTRFQRTPQEHALGSTAKLCQIRAAILYIFSD